MPRPAPPASAVAGPKTPRAASISALAEIWNLLGGIPDPEIPVISIVELGIVRDVAYEGSTLVVSVTPTYSGCPATAVIAGDIAATLNEAGYTDHRMRTQLAPAWSTDWIEPAARERLRLYGIAPPGERVGTQRVNVSGLRRHAPPRAIACPRCGSLRTREISAFGSTPCKAQHRCDDCLEPFDYFKPI
ncbi:MAG: 1,2-phenylacetyl-CoA epoxidase subunit PaaD [Betaproteobacteria bacterium]